jgi:hypothetical protein
MLFEILARRAKISNKRKEKYLAAAGHGTDCVSPAIKDYPRLAAI